MQKENYERYFNLMQVLPRIFLSKPCYRRITRLRHRRTKRSEIRKQTNGHFHKTRRIEDKIEVKRTRGREEEKAKRNSEIKERKRKKMIKLINE